MALRLLEPPPLECDQAHQIAHIGRLGSEAQVEHRLVVALRSDQGADALKDRVWVLPTGHGFFIGRFSEVLKLARH
jgi:hypothetical protein